MFEELMEDKIIAFMQREGYSPYVQIPLFLGKIDFVGVRDSECMIIESKVGKWKKALKQALRYGYGADTAYVALPSGTARNVRAKHQDTFEGYGVGLIEVSNDATVLIPSSTIEPSALFKSMILEQVEKRASRSSRRIERMKGRW